MKAFIARSQDGAVKRGWLLRDGVSIHSTMCRLKRTQPDEVTVEDASVETMLRSASEAAATAQAPRIED